MLSRGNIKFKRVNIKKKDMELIEKKQELTQLKQKKLLDTIIGNLEGIELSTYDLSKMYSESIERRKEENVIIAISAESKSILKTMRDTIKEKYNLTIPQNILISYAIKLYFS